MSDPSSPHNSDKLVTKALRKVLSALVRLVVRQGITFPEFSEILKKAYVDEVKKGLENAGEKSTLSRISVVSGVHRKDVKRLTEMLLVDESTTPEKTSLTSRLISLWLGDSRFLDEHGEPLVLARSGTPSFESLVLSVSSDIRPRTILDDWLQRGLISENEIGYRLNQKALFPTEDMATKISFFARNTTDHIAACEYNLRNMAHPLPERSVFYDGLSESSIQALETLSREESQALLIRINKKAQQLAEKDDQGNEGKHRFILGTYFYREREDKDE